MNLLPYENFHIITELKPDEVQMRLQRVAYIPDVGFLGAEIDRSYLFIGEVYNRKFRLEPNVYNERAGYKPIITGIIEPVETGSRMSVKVAPSAKIIIMYAIVIGFDGLITLGAIKSKEWPIIILAVLTPFVAYLLSVAMIASDVVGIRLNLMKALG